MENSIEEDIKILEKKIEDYELYKNIEYCSPMGQILQAEHKAIEHILSDYKRVLRENKELKNSTRKNENELEFDIDCDWIALQKILDESERSNEYISYKNEKWIKEKYCVPIQKIKDKIEELKKNPLKIKQNGKYYYETSAYNKIIISVLQELLEK